jgi:hypothetical protein
MKSVFPHSFDFACAPTRLQVPRSTSEGMSILWE